MLKVEPWAREKKGFCSEDGERWRQRLRGPSGKYSDRVLIKKLKEILARIFNFQAKYSPDPYSIKIAEAVCSILKMPGRKPFGIRSGWGDTQFV